MCWRVFTVGVYFWWVSGRGNGEEVGRLEGSVVGCSLGDDGEADVVESVAVESENMGGESGLDGVKGVLRSISNKSVTYNYIYMQLNHPRPCHGS